MFVSGPTNTVPGMVCSVDRGHAVHTCCTFRTWSGCGIHCWNCQGDSVNPYSKIWPRQTMDPISIRQSVLRCLLGGFSVSVLSHAGRSHDSAIWRVLTDVGNVTRGQRFRITKCAASPRKLPLGVLLRSNYFFPLGLRVYVSQRSSRNVLGGNYVGVLRQHACHCS